MQKTMRDVIYGYYSSSKGHSFRALLSFKKIKAHCLSRQYSASAACLWFCVLWSFEGCCLINVRLSAEISKSEHLCTLVSGSNTDIAYSLGVFSEELGCFLLICLLIFSLQNSVQEVFPFFKPHTKLHLWHDLTGGPLTSLWILFSSTPIHMLNIQSLGCCVNKEMASVASIELIVTTSCWGSVN